MLADYSILLIGAILVNNFVLVQFLGLCPFMGVSNKLETAMGMSMATTFVLTLASACSNLTYHYLLEPLGLAVQLGPESPRYAYVYGIALHSAGQTRRALAVLDESHRAMPTSVDLLVSLATIHRDEGDAEAALVYARRLLALRPEDPRSQELVSELEAKETEF